VINHCLDRRVGVVFAVLAVGCKRAETVVEKESPNLPRLRELDFAPFEKDLAAIGKKRLAAVEKLPGYKHPTKAAFDPTWDGTRELSATPYLQGALMVMDNATGGILTLVGGRDYQQSKFNRATIGERSYTGTSKTTPEQLRLFETLDLRSP
jgi:membrane carboxypeptidase/penicillin-binding protein